MKLLPATLLLLVLVLGCNFVGNSPEERRHRKRIQTEEETFNRQRYERRTDPDVQETEVYFSFTNRLAQRDAEPMDLEELGKLFVNEYGSNVAWQVVATAWTNYTGGAPLDQATNVMWLVSQSPRARDTGWLIAWRRQWMP